MDKTFLFGLGLATVSVFFPYVITDIPPIISWIGIAIGLVSMLVSGLLWLRTKKLIQSPAAVTANTPKVMLLPARGQLNLHNNGTEDIYIWGSKFADTSPNIEKEQHTVPAGHFYYFLTDK